MISYFQIEDKKRHIVVVSFLLDRRRRRHGLGDGQGKTQGFGTRHGVSTVFT